MMPIIMVTERDLVNSLMRQIGIRNICANCGHVYPEKAVQWLELTEAILIAIRPYRVRHVLDDVDALIAEPPKVSQSAIPPGLHLGEGGAGQ